MINAPVMSGTAVGSIVLVYLTGPREKVWGLLLDLGPAGAWIRGLDLNSFDDWLRGLDEPEEQRPRPSTVFYPLVRIEKILRDEPADGAGSLEAQCRARTGRSLRDLIETFEGGS